MLKRCLVVVACCAWACGGGAEVKSPDDAEGEAIAEAAGDADDEATADDGGEEEASAEDEAEEESGIPTKCTQRSDDLCLPPPKFVKKLCNGEYADVALIMFQGPWTRGYLKGRTEAINASGGASVAGWLEFDEEVVLVRARKPPKGGMQISGEGIGYDGLRWNGSCATLDGGEVTLNEPPQAKHSRIEWRWLGDSMRKALRKDEGINQTYRARRKECKGVTMGTVSKKCEQLDHKLTDVIAEYVRSGGALGEPESTP